jgi:hypothetical protein
VDPRAGLDYVDKRTFLPLLGRELGSLCHPTRSQSLYRMSYPGSHKYNSRTVSRYLSSTKVDTAISTHDIATLTEILPLLLTSCGPTVSEGNDFYI